MMIQIGQSRNFEIKIMINGHVVDVDCRAENDHQNKGHPFMTWSLFDDCSLLWKLASFLPEFRLWTNKKWKFFGDIN